MAEQYAELTAILRVVRARWRSLVAMRAWSRTATIAALVLGLALTTHVLAQPKGLVLVLLWGGASALAAACVGWGLMALRRRPGDRQIARYIEECCPELDDTLVTAIAEYER